MEKQSSNHFFTERLKKTLVIVLLILAAFIAMKTVNAVKEYQFIGGGVPVTNTITISGEGEVFAVPDIATFTFSIVEEKLNAKGAQEVATEKVNSILAFLKESGVEERDIKTINYNLYPRYEYVQEICNEFRCPPGERVLKGFEVNQTVSVKVRDTEEAGTILVGIGERGVSNVSGLNFTIDEEEELQREARKKAIDDAKEKAKELAKDLGVRLVRVVNFSEYGGGVISPRFDFALESVGIQGKVVSVPDIPAGENKITSNISITYEIR